MSPEHAISVHESLPVGDTPHYAGKQQTEDYFKKVTNTNVRYVEKELNTGALQSVLKDWGLEQHKIMFIYQNVLQSARYESLTKCVINSLRLVNAYDGKVICIFMAPAEFQFENFSDFKDAGVRFVRVLCNTNAANEKVKDINDDPYSHYLLSPKSVSDCLGCFLEQSSLIILQCDKTDDDNISKFSAKSLGVPLLNFGEYHNNVGYHIDIDTVSSVDMFLTILGACLKTEVSNHAKNTGTIIPAKEYGQHTVMKKYTVMSKIQPIPRMLSDDLPDHKWLIEITLSDRNQDLEYVEQVLQNFHSDDKGKLIDNTLILLHDIHNTLMKNVNAEKSSAEQICQRNISKRTIAIVTSGVKSMFNSETRVPTSDMFHMSGRNNYVGTYVIFDKSGCDEENTTWKDVINRSIWKRSISVDHSGDTLMITVSEPKISEVQMYEFSAQDLTAHCLSDLILACLREDYTTFECPDAAIQSLESITLSEHSTDNFKTSLLMKLASRCIKLISVDSEGSDSKSAIDNTAKLGPMVKIVKEILTCSKKTKFDVRKFILNYMKLNTAESVKKILQHPLVEYRFAGEAQTIKYGDGSAIVQEIVQMDVEDACCRLGMILGHLGRTSELSLFLKYSEHKFTISYLLYNAGIFGHESKKGHGEDMVLTKVEDEDRIRQCGQDFEHLAGKIINDIYKQDKKKVSQCILFGEHDKEMPHSIIELAYMAKAKNFLSDGSCSYVLNRQWWGDLYDTSMFAIIIYMFLPFLWLVNCHCVKCFQDNDTGQESLVGTEKHRTNHCWKVQTKSKDKVRCIDIYSVPAVKCIFHFMFYLVFIATFSVFVLKGPDINVWFSILEYVNAGMIFALFIDEIMQAVLSFRKNSKMSVLMYIGDFWNCLDVIMFTVYILAVILRILAHHTRIKDMLDTAHFLYALCVVVIYVRSLQFFSMHKQIGPLIMVGYMFKDMMYFMVILIVVLLGYGVALQAILNPLQELTRDLFSSIIQSPYLHLIGDLDVEEILAAPNDANPCGPEPDPQLRNYYGLVLAGSYLLFTNVLLLNLLIAMFNESYSRVKQETVYHHLIHMTKLLIEYREKYILPVVLVGPFLPIVDACNSRSKTNDKQSDGEDQYEIVKQINKIMSKNEKQKEQSVSNYEIQKVQKENAAKIAELGNKIDRLLHKAHFADLHDN